MVDQSNRLNKLQITALRTEILKGALDEKTHFKRGVVESLAKKYGISSSSIGFHRKQALENPKPYRNGHAAPAAPDNQQTLDVATGAKKSPASREDIDMKALHADIEAGEMDEDELREKYGISGSLLYRVKREKQEEIPITPLKPDQCKRVIEVISKLAELHPEKFTRLDFLGQISKKYGSILSEII